MQSAPAPAAGSPGRSSSPKGTNEEQVPLKAGDLEKQKP